jgi:aspartate racemase
MSWVSTIDYYRIINRTINERVGGIQTARLILYSVNYGEFVPGFNAQAWRETAVKFVDIACKLQDAGADGLLLCANTPHKVADDVRAAITIPLIHIAEVTARAIQARTLHTVGLIGTRFTMEEDFFVGKLTAAGIHTVIPEPEDRDFIHTTIFGELSKGIVTAPIKERYLRIVDGLQKRGAEGVILGCTEIPLVVKPEDVSLLLFDTTVVHAMAAVDFALSD